MTSETGNLFGVSIETFVKQVEKASSLNSSKEEILFTLNKNEIKDFIRPIRKHLKYKYTEDAYVNINCDKKSPKKITLYFDNAESYKQDPEKHIVIYFNKVYESKTMTSYNMKSYTKTFESKDQQLKELVKPLFKHISEKINDIFGKKKTQYVPMQEKFKKRFF